MQRMNVLFTKHRGLINHQCPILQAQIVYDVYLIGVVQPANEAFQKSVTRLEYELHETMLA